MIFSELYSAYYNTVARIITAAFDKNTTDFPEPVPPTYPMSSRFSPRTIIKYTINTRTVMILAIRAISVGSG